MTKDIVMEGVREYSGGLPVKLGSYAKDRLCVQLDFEWEPNALIDLEDLLEWLSKQENMDQARMLKILTKLRGE